MGWSGNNHGHLTYQEQDNMRRQADIFLEEQRAFNERDRRFNERRNERYALEEARRIQRELEIDAEIAAGREEATSRCYTPDLVEMNADFKRR